MARTLPPYYVPSTHVFDGVNYLELPIEIRSDSSSIEGYMTSSISGDTVWEDDTHDGRKSSKDESPISKETNSPSIKNSSPSPKKICSPSIKKSTISPDSKSLSLSMIKYPSQTFPPKPHLKSIIKFKNKLPIRRKKRLFSLSFRNKKFRNRALKRKISSSENEQVSKKQSKQMLRAPKSISAISKIDLHTQENPSVGLVYDQPSTSKILNKPGDNLSISEDSATTVDDVTEQVALSHSFRRSSEKINYGEISPEKVIAMSADECYKNDSDVLSCLKKVEKIENKYFCSKSSREARDTSVAGEVENQKASYVVRYENDYDMNKPLIPEKGDSCSNETNTFSSTKSLQQLHRERLTEGRNPIRVLFLKEMLKEMLFRNLKRRQKKNYKNTLIQTIKEDKSSNRESVDERTNASAENQRMTDSENSPLNNSLNLNKKKSEENLNSLQPRNDDKDCECDIRWVSFEIYRSGERHCVLKNVFNTYSAMGNPWRVRVLRWINSVIPELTYDVHPSEGQIQESRIKVSRTSSAENCIGNIDNMHGRPGKYIENTNVREKTVIETIDLEEIDVETIDIPEELKIEIEEETDEYISDETSSNRSTQLKSSIFYTPETEFSDFHSPESQSSESQSSKNQSPDRLSLKSKLTVKMSNENKSVCRKLRENGVSIGSCIENKLMNNQPPENELVASQTLKNKSALNKPPEFESSADQQPENDLLAIKLPKIKSSDDQQPENDSLVIKLPEIKSSATELSANDSVASQPPVNYSVASQPPVNESVAKQRAENKPRHKQPLENESTTYEPPENKSTTNHPPENGFISKENTENASNGSHLSAIVSEGSQSPENESEESQVPENESEESQAPENESEGSQSPENELENCQSSENESDGSHSPENESEGSQSPENEADGSQSSENEFTEYSSSDSLSSDTCGL